MGRALDYFKTVIASYERAVDQIKDDHASKVTLAVRRQLLEWKTRFPRHDFRAWEAHGLLVFEVHPPIMGEKYVADLVMSRTGSTLLADLAAEARDMQDLWNTEFTVSPMGDTATFEIKDLANG
jgi:hypothetical protein